MTLAVILLVGAALIAVAAPTLLRPLTDTALTPRTVLAAWLGSIGGTVFFGASAVAVSLWPEHAPAESAVETLVRCWSVLSHTAAPGITAAVAGAVTVALALAAIRTTVVGRRHTRESRRVRTYHREVVAIVARSRGDVMWLDHPLPMAYSVGGRPGFVVATEGLSACLSAGEREAVLAHERAHLRGQHHRIVNVCNVLAEVFPRVPLFAAAPTAVTTLVELTADQHAARVTSPATVRSALTAVSASTLPRPAGTLGLSNDTSLRLWKLRIEGRARWPWLSCAAMGTVSMVGPIFTVLAGAGAVSALVCT
ncbi:M56 family metallopeptidase [Rhodococcus pyridinivorans]|uniref:M56 family metallopeptidase n=1 Tax=Rhodococcus pyridinivorans TaxID=103816 RepID=UPI0002E05B59|nr:M56 family metallopeptidase [Rhodococcus pyridinivorans]